MIQPIFATANLAIRKEAFDEIGIFDTYCKTGEDVDLSIRLAKTNWELFFEPRAIIRHKHRTSLPALLKQWYGYGKYHPYIFKKHTAKCLKIYYVGRKRAGWSCLRLSRIFGIPVPLHIAVFVTPFHICNLLFVPLLVCLIVGSRGLLAAFAAVWFLTCLGYKGASLTQKRHVQTMGRRVMYFGIKYVQNWVYVLGAFIAGLKEGVIYIEATRE